MSATLKRHVGWWESIIVIANFLGPPQADLQDPEAEMTTEHQGTYLAIIGTYIENCKKHATQIILKPKEILSCTGILINQFNNGENFKTISVYDIFIISFQMTDVLIISLINKINKYFMFRKKKIN